MGFFSELIEAFLGTERESPLVKRVREARAWYDATHGEEPNGAPGRRRDSTGAGPLGQSVAFGRATRIPDQGR